MSQRGLARGAFGALALLIALAFDGGGQPLHAQGYAGDGAPRKRARVDDAYRPSPDEVAGPFTTRGRSYEHSPGYSSPRGDEVQRAPLDDPSLPPDRHGRYAPRTDDAYRPPVPYRHQPVEEQVAGRPYASPPGTYGSPSRYDDATYRPPYGPGARHGSSYAPAPPGDPHYAPLPRDPRAPADGTFSVQEIQSAGHNFFGALSQGLASVIEYAFRKQGRPNGYILGEDLGGAFVAGLRYGRGWLYTRDAGVHPVYWQGPSIGWDAGAEGSKVMVLAYRLRDPQDIYRRFGGVAGSAYVVGGVGLNFQVHDDIVLAPIRTGIGLRLGANIGYLKYTRRPTWNPF